MVDSVRVDVQERTEEGSTACRRLRRTGRIPGVLYGLGRDNRKLSLPTRQIEGVLQNGAHIVELALGDKTQVALIKELQYDATGHSLVHVDFQRIDRNIPVHVWIGIKFIGMAPAVAGSVVEKIREEVQVEVLPLEIPKDFVINLATLAVGKHITIGELGLPDTCKPYHCNLSDVVVVNHVRHVREETPVAAEGSVEPEVIGAKKTDEAAPAKDAKKDTKKK